MAFAEFGVIIPKEDTKLFRRIKYDIKDEEKTLRYYRKKYHNTDIFRSIFTYDSEVLSLAKIKGPLYFDFDCADSWCEGFIIQSQVRHCIIILQQYLKIPAEQILLYYSGNKGFHVIVPQEVLNLGYCEGFDLLKSYKDLANFVKQEWETRYLSKSYLDCKIYDQRRMFRLPNSFNSKGQGYKVLLTHDWLDRYQDDIVSVAELMLGNSDYHGIYCPEAREAWLLLTEDDGNSTPAVKPKKANIHKGEILPCINNVLNTSVIQGNRNNIAVMLANALFQNGMSTEEVEITVKDWNEKNKPPLPEYEIYNVIKSAKELFMTDKTYGCSSMKQYDFCDKHCKFCKRKG